MATVAEIVAAIDKAMYVIPAGQIDTCTRKVLKVAKVMIRHVEGITPANAEAVVVGCDAAGATYDEMTGIVAGVSHILIGMGGLKGHVTRVEVRNELFAAIGR